MSQRAREDPEHWEEREPLTASEFGKMPRRETFVIRPTPEWQKRGDAAIAADTSLTPVEPKEGAEARVERVTPMNARERLASVTRARGFAGQAHEHIARTPAPPAPPMGVFIQRDVHPEYVTLDFKEDCLTLVTQLQDKLAQWAQYERDKLA